MRMMRGVWIAAWTFWACLQGWGQVPRSYCLGVGTKPRLWDSRQRERSKEKSERISQIFVFISYYVQSDPFGGWLEIFEGRRIGKERIWQHGRIHRNRKISGFFYSKKVGRRWLERQLSNMPAIFLEIYYMPKINTLYSTKISGENTVLYQISHVSHY